MSKIISILSGKGGVGKTTLTANLSTVLQTEFGKNVAAVDGNITSPSLGLHFGFHEKFPVSLNDVLEGKLKIQKCVYVHPSIGVSIIPCNFSFYSDKNVDKLKKVIKGLKYDYIIIDSAPGLGKEAITAMEAADEIIVITVPQFVDISNALKTLQLARKMRKRIIGVVLNRVQNAEHEISEAEIEKLCGCKILAEIPEDKEVQKSTYRGMPLIVEKPNSGTADRFRQVAQALGLKASVPEHHKKVHKEEKKHHEEPLGDLTFLDKLSGKQKKHKKKK